jgi:hypothetical protein
VIVRKFSKSYDTSDGSEQHREDGAAPATGSRQTAAQRWADDGGAWLPAAPPPISTELITKPAWSVLSLADLKEALRRASCADNPLTAAQREAASARRAACAAVAAAEARRAEAAHAWADRYRNAWEHT